MLTCTCYAHRIRVACTLYFPDSQNQLQVHDHVARIRMLGLLVRTGSTHRIARYDLRMSSRIALKAEEPGLQHELAHTCTLEGAPINTQPDPRAVG